MPAFYPYVSYFLRWRLQSCSFKVLGWVPENSHAAMTLDTSSPVTDGRRTNRRDTRGESPALGKDPRSVWGFPAGQPSELAGSAPTRCHCEFISRMTDSLPHIFHQKTRALPVCCQATCLGLSTKMGATEASDLALIVLHTGNLNSSYQGGSQLLQKLYHSWTLKRICAAVVQTTGLYSAALRCQGCHIQSVVMVLLPLSVCMTSKRSSLDSWLTCCIIRL